jgi:putative endonuclease
VGSASVTTQEQPGPGDLGKPATGYQHVRSRRGQAADRRGRTAEDAARLALERDGWSILARRLRTPAGEIDMVAEKDGLLAIVEVKARPNLADAAASVSDKQQARLIAATEIVLAENPDWGAEGVRFDLLLVDSAGVVRRIADAFRGSG